MLTETMTDTEKKDEILKDKDFITTQLEKIVSRKDYVRTVKKAPFLPYDYVASFKTPRGNRYTAVLTIRDRRKSLVEPLVSIYTKLSTSEGLYMIRMDFSTGGIIIYTPHLFSRYRERHLKDESLSSEDVMDLFARRNISIVEGSGTNAHVGACRDGYLYLKHKEEDIMVAVTFIDHEDLNDTKKDITTPLLEQVKRYEEVVNCPIDDDMDEALLSIIRSQRTKKK